MVAESLVIKNKPVFGSQYLTAGISVFADTVHRDGIDLTQQRRIDVQVGRIGECQPCFLCDNARPGRENTGIHRQVALCPQHTHNDLCGDFSHNRLILVRDHNGIEIIGRAKEVKGIGTGKKVQHHAFLPRQVFDKLDVVVSDAEMLRSGNAGVDHRDDHQVKVLQFSQHGLPFADIRIVRQPENRSLHHLMKRFLKNALSRIAEDQDGRF